MLFLTSTFLGGLLLTPRILISMWPCASHTTVTHLTATRPIMTLQPTGLQVSARECDSHMYIVHTCMRNSNNGIQFSHEGDTESRKTNKDMDE